MSEKQTPDFSLHDSSFPNYSIINISWWNYPKSMVANDYLYLRFYNGTSWSTIRTVEGWQVGIEDIYLTCALKF